MEISKEKQSSPERRVITLPLFEPAYNEHIEDAIKFREYLDNMIESSPELFPKEIREGYQLKEIYISKKIGIIVRRIKTKDRSYTVHPSFVMPLLKKKNLKSHHS